MDLVDLIVFVCALANPADCRDEHILVQSAGSLRVCMVQAQPYLAHWIGEHPNLQIVRWRCEWPDAEGKAI